MFVEFHGLRFDLPDGWTDITEDLPSGSPPSLAKPEGVGVIQFSIAKYRGGEVPNVTVADLEVFLEQFCQRHDLNCSDVVRFKESVESVEATSFANDEIILARYFSNGRDVVLATYVCQETCGKDVASELADVQHIMKSMEF